MPDSIGVAVIGLDHWYSAFHVLDQIIAEDEMRLVGIADQNPQHLEGARQQYRPDVATTRAEQLLEDESVDLVFSFVPTSMNVSVCLEALGRGKHALCVKPPALTLDDANRLAGAAEDAGVIWSSFEVSHRLTERSRLIKQMIQDGRIGEPISFYHVAHGGLPQPWREQHGDSWWLDPGHVPGGAWIDHAIYAVDQVRFTLEREVESVSGILSNRRHTELGVEDHGMAWLRLAGGFTALMEDAWTAESSTHFNRYIGSAGSLILDSEHLTIVRDGNSETVPIPEETRTPFSRLAAAVLGRERLHFNTSCSVHNLAACLAVYESARTGKHVTLP